MKITAPLLLLPLLLAACGTQSATPVTSASTITTASATDIAAFEAGVQRDLATLSLTGILSAQAVTPKSYLNVLKVSDTTARAYMKTTYPIEVGCALDWGDGTETGAVTTPSVVATDKADHIYTQSGTYTVKLTCGADVKTSAFTAVVPQTELGLMEDYTGGFDYVEGDYKFKELGGAYTNKGFTFTSDYQAIYAVQGSIFNVPDNHTSIMTLAYDEGGRIYKSYFRNSNGNVFDLLSIYGSSYGYGNTATGYDSNGNIVGTIDVASGAMKKYVLNWKNVKYVEITNHNGFYGYLNIDDMSVNIRTGRQ